MNRNTNGENPVSPQRPKRSVSLTAVEIAWLKGFAEQFPTMVAAGIKIGIDRTVLERVLTYGSGAEATVNTIRAYIKSAKRKKIAA